MDFSGPGIIYILLVIPSLFALAVVVQGLYKISRQEADGQIALGFGVTFLVIIGVAYFFFIR
ncbi:MAG: hypothetical protein ACOY0S_00970 [Patescibacteria group bacterium]